VRQLPLELSARPAPAFDNFVAGENREALEAVRAMAAGTLAEPIVYLWGEAGSGRTHLLRAAERAAPSLHVVDDVDALDAEGQQALFVAINEARNGRGAVLASGPCPPAALTLREDLRSRLGWGLVYQLRVLSDSGKREHLRSAARTRGLDLPEEVADYLLARLPRNLGSLNEVLERLDRLSLARQRALTIPLAREALGEAGRELMPRQRESG
jgi:DnaA family protein